MTVDERLVRLARAHGLALDFWDWKGRPVAISQDSVRAVLSALDVDTSSDEAIERALDDLDRRHWNRVLPPFVIVEAGAEVRVPVHVRAGADAQLLVHSEAGHELAATQVPDDEPDRFIDGRQLGQATFTVGPGLPVGYHELVLRSEGEEFRSRLVVSPPFVGFGTGRDQHRVWGYATQLYSVCSRRGWGIGDLDDLSALATWSAHQGADYVLVNPLHAAQPVAPIEPSPYLPTSRRFISPLYLRPEDILEAQRLDPSGRRRLDQLRDQVGGPIPAGGQLQRDPVWTAKLEALELVFAAGRSQVRQYAFENFCRLQGQTLQRFATWCALARVHGANWSTWPIELQRPDTDQVRAFAADHQDDITFWCWVQWQCDQQLSNAQQACRDNGMSVGLVQDLAVGVNRYGADTWGAPELFAEGVSVGAPPDQYNQLGQDWGQPPMRPDVLAEQGYEPFRQLVATMLRHAGGLRIDHIIGLFRLWWVPPGMAPDQGCYVRYDHEAMIGLLALEAQRADAVIIGEDLGTVEPWVRTYLERRGLLGTSVLWFEYDDQGNLLEPERWREYCLGSVTTHDLPPTAGYLAGDHVRLRHQLGLLTESLETELGHARDERQAMINLLARHGLVDQNTQDDDVVLLAMHEFLLRTPARMLNVALTDAVGDHRTQNQPGTIDQYPNWRVPLSDAEGNQVMLEDVFTSPRAEAMAQVMNQTRDDADPR